jgi:hypothetical protein
MTQECSPTIILTDEIYLKLRRPKKMKPGLSTTSLSTMQTQGQFGGMPMRGIRLMEGPEPPAPQPNPPAPAPQPQPRPAPPAPDPQPRATSSGHLETDLANTRAEAASYRIRARDAEEARQAAEARATQAAADAARQVQEAQAAAAATANRIKERTRDAELRAAAQQAGIRDPDLIPLIDRGAITVDDEGNVTGAAEAVAAFKAKKPEYFQPSSPNPAPAPQPRLSGAPGPIPAPQATIPPTSVLTIPKTAEGKRDYEAQKAAALRALR